MESSARKFQSLTVDNKYKVIGKYDINTNFGKSYILLVKDYQTNESFELFSTKSITSYIDTRKISVGGFEFIVKMDEKTKLKIPEIENYSYQSKSFQLF